MPKWTYRRERAISPNKRAEIWLIERWHCRFLPAPEIFLMPFTAQSHCAARFIFPVPVLTIEPEISSSLAGENRASSWVLAQLPSCKSVEYTVYRGTPFILCDPALRGIMRLWVIWHEGAHYLLHTPQMQLFDKGYTNKADMEANMIASVAVIPKKLLRKPFGELQDEYGYPTDLLWVRKDVYERYKI